MLKIGRSIIPVKQTDGVTMLASGFDDLRTRILPRLAALSCALFMSAATVSAQPQVPAESRLKGIIANKTIRIAHRADARPFSFVNDANEPLGYTVDLCRQVTQSIAQQFGLQDLKIEWVPVTVDTRFDAVAKDKADLECGSSTVTLGRMKEVDFSIFIFVESTGILVTRASNIHALTELVGKKLAVVSGTSNERAVADLLRQQKLDVTLVRVKDRDEGAVALEAGWVDGFASDKLLLAGAQIKKPEALVLLPDDLSIEQYAIVLPRGDWALRLAVNTGLAQIFRSGKTFEVFERWFFGARPSLLLHAIYALGRLAD
jgi:ABC-type amino acid transport substrate-binding protein